VAPPPPRDEDLDIDDKRVLWWRCPWCYLFRPQLRLRRVERGYCFTCPTCRPLAVVPLDLVLSSEEDEEDEELELVAGDSQ
jgi:hypothetical protein